MTRKKETTADLLGMRRLGGVCEMCMCLAWCGGGGGEWIRGLGLGFTNPVGTWVLLDVCLCLRWCGWRRWGVGNDLDQDLKGWGGVLSV